MDPIVRSVANRFALTIDKASLGKWSKDLKAMTKIYRSIPVDLPRHLEFSSEPDEFKREQAKAFELFFETRSLFLKFKNNFSEWVYKVVLTKPDRKEDETYSEKTVKATASDFIFSMDTSYLFPELKGSSKHTPDLSTLRNTRDSNIRRYQGAAIKTFKRIEQYLDEKGGTIERRPAVDHLEVGGVNVTLLNYGREEYAEDILQETLSDLRNKINRIKRAGFSGAVDGLNLTIDFDSKGKLRAGLYRPVSDELTLYYLGLGDNDHTFEHECGHRFYFRELPGQARKEWEEAMESKVEDISDYANENAEEAFAEVFMLWLSKGPGALGPWTQDLFKRVCRTGGGKLARVCLAAVQRAMLIPVAPNEHYLVECPSCGTVIRQCRCIGPKTIIHEICDKCKGLGLQA
jgi:hypothetical protein